MLKRILAFNLICLALVVKAQYRTNVVGDNSVTYVCMAN